MSRVPHTIITRLIVKNYRSLADIDLELAPLTVLVGRNGTGKGNIVDVLRFVRDALAHGLDSAIMDRHGMNAIRRWSPDGTAYDVSIHLYLKGQDWTGEYGLKMGGQSSEE